MIRLIVCSTREPLVANRRRISGTTPLRDCPEGNVGVALPWPISDRLDGLVTRLEDAAERTSRKELLAALILDAPAEVAELAAILRRYRLAVAGHTRLDGRAVAATMAGTLRRPGPRRRKAL